MLLSVVTKTNEAECHACGAVQSSMNGLARGACGVCYIGYLSGWYVNPSRRICRYKGCGKNAVAEDGKWLVCPDHLKKRRPDFVCR